MYTIQELERLMLKKGLTIRAIPAIHIEKYNNNENNAKLAPNAHIQYDENFKRDMLVEFKSNGKYSNKFIVHQKQDAGSMVWFDKKDKIYNSITEIMDDYMEE